MKVQIQTTQNVDIEYDLATIGERIAAGVIDILICGAYSVVALQLLQVVMPALRDEDSITTYFIFASAVVFLPVLLYHLLCEMLLQGQSFGKRVMQIKVVRIDGSQPSLSAYLLRWMIGLFEVRLLYGSLALLVSMITRSGQRLGDLAAGTTVVKVKRPVTLAQTIFAKVDEDYEPTFASVSVLNDSDVAVIKEVVTSRERAGNPVVLGALSRKVKEVMGVESELPALKFLRTVVRDYNYYAGRAS